MKLSIPMLIVTLTCTNANNIKPYTIPITRNGVTHTMIAYNFWSGEYPLPVINVKPTKKKWTKIFGYSSLQKVDKKIACTIKSGLYHPWSKDTSSIINFYSIVPKIDYIVKKDTQLEDEMLNKGDKLENEVYLSEGYCKYTLNSKKSFESFCINNENREFKLIKHPTHNKEQWLYLECKEGYNIFIKDKDLLTEQNVSKGTIKGYGEVKGN